MQKQEEESETGEDSTPNSIKSEKDTVVTPYAIKNLTEAEIIIEKEADMEMVRRQRNQELLKQKRRQ